MKSTKNMTFSDFLPLTSSVLFRPIMFPTPPQEQNVSTVYIVKPQMPLFRRWFVRRQFLLSGRGLSGYLDNSRPPEMFRSCSDGNLLTVRINDPGTVATEISRRSRRPSRLPDSSNFAKFSKKIGRFCSPS